MKRKVFVFFLIAIFIVAIGYSQSITVTNPHSGDTWYKGGSHHYTIRWTKSGSMNANVKIRLYQGDSRVLAITDSTPNDGEYEWSIPESVDEGTYKIRVKTIDNAVFDDSEEFYIANPPSSFPAITVTNPHSGDIWYKGGSHHYTIRWTKSGSMNANVKIRLYQGDSRVLAITDSTPNDGEYEWSIPESVDEGTYKIRVKTIDNAVSDDGENFEIREESGTMPGTIYPPFSRARDFEIKHISYLVRRGTYLVVHLKNYHNSYDGDLKFRVNVVDNKSHTGSTRYFTKHVRINAGEEKEIYLNMSLGVFSLCGKEVTVTVDPDNTIPETKEDNNTLMRVIYTKKPVFRISITDKQIKKVSHRITYRWRVKFKIKVKAEGRGYYSLSNIYVDWKIEPKDGPPLFRFNGSTFGPFSIRLNEEKTFNVDRKFGHPDLSHSVHARLKEGDYYITVKVRTGESCATAPYSQYRFLVHLR